MLCIYIKVRALLIYSTHRTDVVLKVVKSFMNYNLLHWDSFFARFFHVAIPVAHHGRPQSGQWQIEEITEVEWISF